VTEVNTKQRNQITLLARLTMVSERNQATGHRPHNGLAGCDQLNAEVIVSFSVSQVSSIS
jgi:hypothetical protein